MVSLTGQQIPEEIIGYGKIRPYTGAYDNIGGSVRKTASKCNVPPMKKGGGTDKVVASIEEVLERVGIRDGMTVSFHHHMRNGDYVVNRVMEAIAKKGVKDIHVAASGLFQCHAPLVELMEQGVIRKITLSTISPGPLAKAITAGRLKEPAVFMSHGARPRAIESGDLHIDVAFIAAPACDSYGNMNGCQGKSACGVLAYAYADAEYADVVVAVTDKLVPYPACPIEISQDKVDYVVPVKEIGNPDGISFGPTKAATDPVNLGIARMTAQLLDETGYIREGMSMQTGAGGTSIAVAAEVGKRMKERKIKGSFGSGGITGYFVEMLEEGLFEGLLDTQCFDSQAIASLSRNKNHMAMSASQYANPNNRGAVVNQLDIMILGATELDVDFNLNVITGSNGTILSASGGNQDCAAGSKIAVVATNLLKKGRCMLKEHVTTITTPGETVDVLVTEMGIAVNPRRRDLLERLKGTALPLVDIRELQKQGEAMAEIHDKVEYTNRVVAVVEYRDGTVIDVVRKPKES